MNFLNIFKQYKGLRPELYILFWGRVVTNMGALIWPMLTLILKNKLGYSAGEAANLILLVGVFMLPATLLGGKLADRFNKKTIIVCCDLVTVAGYLLCGFLPVNRYMVLLLAISSIFAQMEWPSYDALVANLSTPEERERAYSLNYLGGNLGLVLAPTLGGILFQNHLNLAFIISGFATLSSTILIFFFVKDISVSKGQGGFYEEEKKISTRELFKGAPVLLLFVACMGIVYAIYDMAVSFMIPLTMDNNFGERGALYLGTLTSVNAVGVIVGTPICTAALSKIKDSRKLHLGAFFETMGFTLLAFSGKHMVMCYISVLITTLGEVLLSLGRQPYITRRVPASHRGRMSAITRVTEMLLSGVCLLVAGHGADVMPINKIWFFFIAFGVFNVLLFFAMRRADRKRFSELY